MGFFSKKDKDLKSATADFAPQLEAIKREIIKQENGNQDKVDPVDPSTTIQGTSETTMSSQSTNVSTLPRNGNGNAGNNGNGYNSGSGNMSGNGNGHQEIPSMLKATVISQGFSFKGEIVGEGALNVDGVFSGRIQVESLSISSTGSVEGEIKANSVKVTGQLFGIVDCVDLTLADKARFEGRVTYESIQIQKGSMFRGEIIKK